MVEPTAFGATGARPRLELLDLLRFAAAIMVVAFHWLFNGISNGKVTSISHGPLAEIAVYGYFGVHLFFIISGYVISSSAIGKSAGQFAAGRAERLFPAFWFAMTLTTLVAFAWGGTVMDPVGGKQFLANLTMAPQLFGEAPIDGVYWTLTIELTFYGLVFGLLFLGLVRHLERFFPLWALGMLAVALIAPQYAGLPYAGRYYALFAAGAIMATIRRRGFSWYQLLGLAAALAVTVRFVAGQVPAFNAQNGTDLSRIGVLAMLVVFFALIALMWLPRVAQMHIPLSRRISELTYPVYLLHAHIGYMALQALANDENKWIVYIVLFAVLLGASWLLHWAVEIRLKKVWRRFFSTILERPITWIRARTGLERLDGFTSGKPRPVGRDGVPPREP